MSSTAVNPQTSSFYAQLGQSVSQGTSWVGRKVSDWSKSASEICMKIYNVLKEGFNNLANCMHQGCVFLRDAAIANPAAAAVIGLVTTVSALALTYFCCRGSTTLTNNPAPSVPVTPQTPELSTFPQNPNRYDFHDHQNGHRYQFQIQDVGPGWAHIGHTPAADPVGAQPQSLSVLSAFPQSAQAGGFCNVNGLLHRCDNLNGHLTWVPVTTQV